MSEIWYSIWPVQVYRRPITFTAPVMRLPSGTSQKETIPCNLLEIKQVCYYMVISYYWVQIIIRLLIMLKRDRFFDYFPFLYVCAYAVKIPRQRFMIVASITMAYLGPKAYLIFPIIPVHTFKVIHKNILKKIAVR